MRLIFVLPIFLCLLSSYSSLDKEKSSPQETHLNNYENIPFEGLQTIRVILCFVSDQIDEEKIREAVVNQFKKMGNVHTPADTSLDKLLEVQAKPFAILVINISEIETFNQEKSLPLLSISAKIYEEGKLALNNQDVMGIVWEKTKYLEFLPEKDQTGMKSIQVIENILNEFSKRYQDINLQKITPSFYIGKNI